MRTIKKTLTCFFSIFAFTLLGTHQGSALLPSQPYGPGPQLATISSENQSSEIGWWQTECVDCPKQVTNRALWIAGNGFPTVYYGCDILYKASYNGTDWEMVSDDRLARLDQISCIDPIIDGNGFPHLIYHDSARNALMYAYETPSGWHFQTVVLTVGIVTYFSLALDGYGEPHISFLGTLLDGTRGLYYAHRQGSDWLIEPVTQDFWGENWIAVDQEGNPHIIVLVSLSEWERGITYAYRNDNGWQIENFEDPRHGMIEAISFVLDQENIAHLSYVTMYGENLGYDLIYAYRNATGWTVQDTGVSLYSSDTLFIPISLGIDAYGQPHLSYISSGQLNYIYFAAEEWIVSIVDNQATGSQSLTLSDDGVVHISYNGVDSENYPLEMVLKHAVLKNNIWNIETIDNKGGEVGGFPSLAIDADDYAHVSYYDEFNQNLNYAQRDGRGWISQTVDKVDVLGAYNSLALGKSVHIPHLSYAQPKWCSSKGGIPVECGHYLKYATYDSNSWQTQTITYVEDGFTKSSLALDIYDNPHIAYNEVESLMYAHLDASGWHTHTVITESYPIKNVSLALDEKNVPYISYIVFDAIHVIYLNEGVWINETVDSGSIDDHSSGLNPFLAIDENGFPHLVYSKIYSEVSLTKYELKYAYRDASGWHTQSIHNGFSKALTYSLVLDANNNPRICYVSNGTSDYNYGIYYVYRDAEGWHFQTVVPQLLNNPTPSIALNKDGAPFIAYKARNGLKYSYSMGDFSAIYLPLIAR